MRELVARSGGALEVEEATGSLFDTLHIRRIVWRGPEAKARRYEGSGRVDAKIVVRFPSCSTSLSTAVFAIALSAAGTVNVMR